MMIPIPPDYTCNPLVFTSCWYRVQVSFASGAVRYGVDAIMETLRSHFENREAVWAWTERYRVVA